MFIPHFFDRRVDRLRPDVGNSNAKVGLAGAGGIFFSRFFSVVFSDFGRDFRERWERLNEACFSERLRMDRVDFVQRQILVFTVGVDLFFTISVLFWKWFVPSILEIGRF